MRRAAFLIGIFLALPATAQAGTLALEESFFVRLDDLRFSTAFGTIYDYENGAEHPDRWLTDRYGSAWYTGMETGTSTTAQVSVHSTDGSLDETMISSVLFTVNGCLYCGYHWSASGHGTSVSMTDTTGAMQVRLGTTAPSSSLWFSMPSGGTDGKLEISAEGDAYRIRTALSEAGHSASYVLPDVSKFLTWSVRTTAFDPPPGSGPAPVPTPLPAPILLLLGGIGAFVAMASRKRRQSGA